MKSWLSGRKGILEVLTHRPEAIRTVYVREGASLDVQLSDSLKRESVVHGFAIESLERDQFDTTFSDVTAQGIVADVALPELDEQSMLARVVETGGVLLIAEHISDPQNLGALFRVAESVGATGIAITKDHSTAITSSVRKAAVGACELLPHCRVKNLQRFLGNLKKHDVWLLGCALDERSSSIYHCPRFSPCALIVGAEGEGMRRLTKEMCDVLLEIPMRGTIQSLNVNQAASIALYEITSPERTKG